jgi:hypothetical protein
LASPPGRRKRCGAKRKRGGHCTRWALKGADRCHMHGGRQQRDAKLRLYSRHLDEERAKVFEEAGNQIDSLDDEIRLAKTNLDWAVEKLQADPTGGIIVQDGEKGTRIRTWYDLCLEHMEKIRRLVHTKTDLLRMPNPKLRELDTYQVWLMKFAPRSEGEEEQDGSQEPIQGQ